MKHLLVFITSPIHSYSSNYSSMTFSIFDLSFNTFRLWYVHTYNNLLNKLFRCEHILQPISYCNRKLFVVLEKEEIEMILLSKSPQNH